MIKSSIILFVLRFYLKFILLTCQFKIHGEKHLNDALKARNSIMLCCWHERLVYLICYFKSWPHRLSVLSSQHQDSEILASILKKWDFHLIKGSSSRGWFGAIKEISKLLNSSSSVIAITNDGPKGPAMIAKEGTLKIALQKKSLILAMSASATKFWTLNTWDKLKLPKPFSIIHVSFCSPYNNTANIDVFNNYLTDHQIKIDAIADENI
tara:strand:- start:251 stop:880 length:630 start_codon:yes stop_codon:yes gene_type:complete